ncbi:MAG TPA: MFS transporter [Gammaproteobacteria bacterium]|jgi:AAHS family 4-hydroxybenzoate transporter-like MFS transporter|nr:MFS transporter [Gammaproteobacteria bacterium]
MQTTGAPAATLNLTEFMDLCRIGPLQIRVFALCLASLIMDGFDVQAMGYVAPAMFAEWNVPAPTLGPLLSIGHLGVMIGALVFSMLADKIGRRPVLVFATLFFAVMTIATAFAANVQQMLWLRFVAGLGLGCIIPNATALVGEFSPKRTRVAWVMCITMGFTLGAAIGGFVANELIPLFGWRSVFVFGGVVPLIVAIGMFFGLPESLQFLAVRKQRFDQLARWLRQLDPSLNIDAATEFVASETSKGGVPFWHLFREGRALVTALFWVVNFTNILVLYSLSGWLPTVFQRFMGYDQSTAILLGTTVQIGGTIGAFGLAWLIIRAGFIPMLTLSFVVATVSVALIGQPGLSLPVLYAIVFIAGWCVVGAQPGLNALSASYYPTYLRSTGVGAGLGVGRLGAILGPSLAALLVAQQWSPQQLLWAAALPALVSTLVLVALWFVIGPSVKPTGAEPEAVPLPH